MENVLKLDQDGEIARITIDRPEKGNMLTLEMLDYVSALIIDAGCDPDIKAISLTSTGDDFCLGRDRSLPKSVAWMVYSTKELDAQKAHAAGFVSHVVPAEDLRAETEMVLETLASRDRVALATCKAYLSNARLMETPQASEYAASLLAVVMSSKGG